MLCISHNFDSSCHSCGQVTNSLSCSEGGKVIHPFAAGVSDVEFTCLWDGNKTCEWRDPSLTRRARNALAVIGEPHADITLLGIGTEYGYPGGRYYLHSDGIIRNLSAVLLCQSDIILIVFLYLRESFFIFWKV
jgi:hypothetical protein